MTGTSNTAGKKYQHETRKLPGPVMMASNEGISASIAEWIDLWLQPDATNTSPLRLFGVHLNFPLGSRAIFILGADSCLFNTDWPYIANTIEQSTESINGGKRVAALLFHHRQQQVSARMSSETIMLEPRKTGQQYPTGLRLIAS